MAHSDDGGSIEEFESPTPPVPPTPVSPRITQASRNVRRAPPGKFRSPGLLPDKSPQIDSASSLESVSCIVLVLTSRFVSFHADRAIVCWHLLTNMVRYCSSVN